MIESCGLFVFLSPVGDSPDVAGAMPFGAMQVTEELSTLDVDSCSIGSVCGVRKEMWLTVSQCSYFPRE